MGSQSERFLFAATRMMCIHHWVLYTRVTFDCRDDREHQETRHEKRNTFDTTTTASVFVELTRIQSEEQ